MRREFVGRVSRAMLIALAPLAVCAGAGGGMAGRGGRPGRRSRLARQLPLDRERRGAERRRRVPGGRWRCRRWPSACGISSLFGALAARAGKRRRPSRWRSRRARRVLPPPSIARRSASSTRGARRSRAMGAIEHPPIFTIPGVPRLRALHVGRDGRAHRRVLRGDPASGARPPRRAELHGDGARAVPRPARRRDRPRGAPLSAR